MAPTETSGLAASGGANAANVSGVADSGLATPSVADASAGASGMPASRTGASGGAISTAISGVAASGVASPPERLSRTDPSGRPQMCRPPRCRRPTGHQHRRRLSGTHFQSAVHVNPPLHWSEGEHRLQSRSTHASPIVTGRTSASIENTTVGCSCLRFSAMG